ncbi:hypothetical protein ACHAQA_006564 [Verticillium albo-atrum]
MAEINFTSFGNLINGELRSSTSLARGTNPSDRQPLWEIPQASKQDLEDAVTSARDAHSSWKKTSWGERRRLLLAAKDVLMANQEQLAILITKEGGKPIEFSRIEIDHTGKFLQFNAELPEPEEKIIQDDEDLRLSIRQQPVGVVAAIIPWNFPLVLAVAKIATAFVAGNCVIVKPSPFTPYSIVKYAELIKDLFPPGVLQVLNGDSNLGPWLCAHPGIDKIAFTGSSATGKKIMATAAETLKTITLELGGNSASIVCADINPKIVAPQIAVGSFFNSGQFCLASKRIYVHESIYDEFLAELVNTVKSWKIGPTSDLEEGITLGPVQNDMQYGIVHSFFREAADNDFRFALGGPIASLDDAKNFVIPPAIIDNPPDESLIVKGEPFGPIVPVLKWSTEEEVLRRVNNTLTGLGGTVWSKDVERARSIAERVESGTVWINSFEKPLPHAHLVGYKESGVGGEWGQEGLQAYLKPQVIHSYKGPREESGFQFQIREVPVHELQPDEILVKLSASGVCGTDLGLAAGYLGPSRDILGHEGVGRAISVGSAVDPETAKVGDRIGITWVRDACGRCFSCREPGGETRCLQQLNSGRKIDGTFAEYCVVPSRYTLVLPDDPALPDELVAPVLCGGVTAYKALKICGATPGQWVVISGAAGGVGALGIQYAVAMGYRVVAIDVGTERKDYCLELGAEAYLDALQEDVVAQVKSVTGGAGARAVIVSSGAGAAYQAGLLMLSMFGTLVCVGIPPPGQAMNLHPLYVIDNGITIIGSAVGTRTDVLEALDFVKRGLVKPLVTLIKLADLDEVIRKLGAVTQQDADSSSSTFPYFDNPSPLSQILGISMDPTHDFIIVGSGPAGSAIAAGLARSAKKPRVLLIEAGGRNEDENLRVDGQRWLTLLNKDMNWGYQTVPQEHCDSRVVDYARGKGLGGSSAINFSVHSVGPKDDYDEWARVVDDDAFSWQKMQPRFKSLETFHEKAPPGTESKYVASNTENHGSSGPLQVGYAAEWEKDLIPTLDVFEEAGFPLNPDHNSGNPLGMSVVINSSHKGRRSTANDLLMPVPENLDILTSSTVQRVILEGVKAVGVEVNGMRFLATKEVILSAGALDSPKILMHSGLGPRDQLEQFGLPVVADVPAVGQGLRDHMFCPLVFTRKEGDTDRAAFYGNQKVMDDALEQWKKDRTGDWSKFACELCIGWFKSDQVMESDEFNALPADEKVYLNKETIPHFEIITHGPAHWFIPDFPPEYLNYSSMLIFCYNAQSRGEVSLQSADPSVPLKFDPKFLDSPFDRRVAIEALRAGLKVANLESYAKSTTGMIAGPQGETDEDLLAYWRATISTSWHMTGTLKMGKPGSVDAAVDQDFRFMGVQNLRVADMSVVPILSNCHIQVVAYLTGLTCAEKLIAEYKLQ